MNKKKTIFIILVIIIFIGIMLLNIPLGYNKISTINGNKNKTQTIELGIPKLSFMKKENSKNYSYKNIRSNKILAKEIKSYLNTLNKINCNNTTYYYDAKNKFTIINYSVKNHILYNTISYEVRYGDYCFSKKMDEYANILGGIRRFHTLNSNISLSKDKAFTPLLVVGFLDDINMDKKEFTATMKVRYLTPIADDWKVVSRKDIEKSTGTYEIKNDKLYYTRTNIELKADELDIPKTSVFKIKDQKLILTDNYLSKYDNNVILE